VEVARLDAVRRHDRERTAFGPLEDRGLLAAHEVREDLLDDLQHLRPVERAHQLVARDVQVREVRVLALDLHELLGEALALALHPHQSLLQVRLLAREALGRLAEVLELVGQPALVLLQAEEQLAQAVVLLQQLAGVSLGVLHDAVDVAQAGVPLPGLAHGAPARWSRSFARNSAPLMGFVM
jgi:hypothetical protein